MNNIVVVVQACLPRKLSFFGHLLSHGTLPSGNDDPAMGFFWGVDRDKIVGTKKSYFLTLFQKKNRENLHLIVVPVIAIDHACGQISREGSLVVRESRDCSDKIFVKRQNKQ